MPASSRAASRRLFTSLSVFSVLANRSASFASFCAVTSLRLALRAAMETTNITSRFIYRSDNVARRGVGSCINMATTELPCETRQVSLLHRLTIAVDGVDNVPRLERFGD